MKKLIWHSACHLTHMPTLPGDEPCLGIISSIKETLSLPEYEACPTNSAGRKQVAVEEAGQGHHSRVREQSLS